MQFLHNLSFEKYFTDVIAFLHVQEGDFRLDVSYLVRARLG